MAERNISVRIRAITDQYRQAMQQASGETRRFGSSVADTVRRNEQHFTRLGIAAGLVGAAITAMAVKSVREFAQFEASIVKMTTLVGVAEEEARALGQAALGLGETGRGPQELGRSLFFATSAGLEGAAALDVVEASAKAASIGLGDTATVTDLVTSAVNAYGSETLSASDATDVLIGTVREGKAEASELAGSMGRVLPIASNMGVSLDQVGAAMAAMTRTGTGASEAATQLRSIMVSLLNPTQQAEEAMAQFGLSSAGLRDTIQQDGLWAALQQIKTAIGDNDQAMSQIFPNVRALAGVLDLTGANAAATGEIFERMTDTTGLLEEGFARWSQTTEASMSRFSAAAETARIQFGEQLAPAFQGALDAGTGFLNFLSGLPGPVQGAIAGIGGLGGVTLTAAGAALLLAPRIVAIRDSVQALGGVSSMARGGLQGLVRFGFHPLTLAVGAAALGFGAYMKAKADAERRSETFLQILGDEIVLLDRSVDAYRDLEEATRRQFATQLLAEHKDLMDVLRETGVTLGDVTSVLMGDTGPAYDRVARAIADNTTVTSLGKEGFDRLTGSGQELARIMGMTADDLDRAGEKQAQLNTVTGDGEQALDSWARSALGWRDAANNLGDGVGGVGDEFDELAGATDEATEALENWRAAQQAVTDPVLGLMDAVQGVADAKRDSQRAAEDLEEAERDLAEVQADSEATADDLARAERRVEDAQIAVTRSSVDVFRALETLRREATDGTISWDEFERQLDSWVAQGEITKREADEIRGEVEEARKAAERYTGRYEAHLRVQGHREARRNLNEIRSLATRTAGNYDVNVRVRATGTSAARAQIASVTGSRFLHTGGEIMPGRQIRRFHSGGQLPQMLHPFGRLRSDEVPLIGQVGEIMLSRRQVSALRDVLGPVLRMHQGGQVSADGRQPQGGFTFSPVFHVMPTRDEWAQAIHQGEMASVRMVR